MKLIIMSLVSCFLTAPMLFAAALSEGQPRLDSPFLEGWIYDSDLRSRKVIFQDVDGKAVVDGDIIIGRTSELLVRPDRKSPLKGNVASGSWSRWPDAVLPFEIDSRLNSGMNHRIQSAMFHWEKHTPIRFVERTSSNASEYPDYVRFTKVDSGCNSWVGRQFGMQEINLSNRCRKGTVIHEIGHAVGLWHEHSRADRDEFIEIAWENIEAGPDGICHTRDAGDYCYAFSQTAFGVDVGAYDYRSIMHYYRRAFSRNGEDTIIPLDPHAGIGQREGLSEGDKAAVRFMYAPGLADETTHQRFESNGVSFFPGGIERLGREQRGGTWLSGDFNGDGRDDIAQVYYADGTASVFAYSAIAATLMGQNHWLGANLLRTQFWRSGDFNGDGLDDLLVVRGYGAFSAMIDVYTSTGRGFDHTSSQNVNVRFWRSARWETGDFDGDGRDDLLSISGEFRFDATAQIFKATHQGFQSSGYQSLGVGVHHAQQWKTGDFDGDGSNDLLLLEPGSNGRVIAATYFSNGAGFDRMGPQALEIHDSEGQHWHTGDFDGDGRDDLLRLYRDSSRGAAAVSYSSDGVEFHQNIPATLPVSYSDDQIWLTADLNGDGVEGVSLLYGKMHR